MGIGGILSLLYLPLSCLQLGQRYRGSAAALRLCIVSGSAGSLLGVLLLAPLGASVLEPDLKRDSNSVLSVIDCAHKLANLNDRIGQCYRTVIQIIDYMH